MAEKILIVDDDEELAELLGLLFNKKGYDTALAYNGKDALRMLDEFQPAIVIQDYMLPDIKGVELLKETKLNRPEAYVVIITARGSEDVAVEMLKAGANDYIKKPFDTDKLVNTVENMLKLRSSEFERYKLICELQRQNKELMGINALSAALTSSMTRSMKCSSAVDIVMKTMRADLTNVFVTSSGSTSLTLQASHDHDGEALREGDFSGRTGLATYILEIKKPAVVADISQEQRIKIPPMIRSLGMSSALGVPMTYKDEFRGVLEVYTKEPRSFPSFDIKLLSSFANLLAMALENEALTAEVALADKRWQATCDAIPERITVQDSGHRIINANKAAAEMVGSSVDDLIGQQCCWMLENIKQPVPGCPVEEAFRTKKPVSKIIKHGEGKKTYQIDASPILDEAGEVELVIERSVPLED